MDSDIEQQQKLKVRMYLKQKKFERLQQKWLEEKQRIEEKENKHRSLIELQKSADSIRIKSSSGAALKDTQSNKEIELVSNSMNLLKVQKMDSRKKDTMWKNKNRLDTEVDFDTQHSIHQHSIKNDFENKELRRLDAKQRWQVSPLIDVLLKQLKSRGSNTMEWFPRGFDYSSRYQHSTQPLTNSNSLSLLVHNVVNEFGKKPRPSLVSTGGTYLANSTSISAIIANHIMMENSIQESTATFHNCFPETYDNKSAPSEMDP